MYAIQMTLSVSSRFSVYLPYNLTTLLSVFLPYNLTTRRRAKKTLVAEIQ